MKSSMLKARVAQAALFEMKKERKNVEFPMWRKKVDDSLLNENITPLPNWLINIWDLKEFSSNSIKDPTSRVCVIFENKVYNGHITNTSRGNSSIKRLNFDYELGAMLKQKFLKSYVRSVERKISKINSENEDDWEFLDIEFDGTNNTFYFTAYYTSKVDYPNLFKQLIDSHVLFDIENKLKNKQLSIFKSDWKQKSELNEEIDAKNVIYNLIDIETHKFYVGESKSLLSRLSVKRPEIPNWTHYRYDKLPDSFGKDERIAIERLLIRTFASVLKSPISKEINISNLYTLANKKIDS